MKKIYLMLLCAACVAFVCCSKDEKTPESEKETLTGLPLAKKVFEQVSGPNALAIMGRSVYTFANKDSDEYAIGYFYKTSADSINIVIHNDTVIEAYVMNQHSGNTISTTCRTYLQDNFGSAPVVKGVTLDSAYAYIRTNNPAATYGWYRLYKYQDIVDSMQTDTKMYECDMKYSNRITGTKYGSNIVSFWGNYISKSNTTELKVGYSILTNE